MSGRDAIAMTPEEVADFLATHLKVQVAVNGHEGTPHLTTLFYVVDDGRVAFWTYARSQKIRNLERDPHIACLVEDGDGYFELSGVSISGTAEIVRDPDVVRRIGSAVAVRMAGVSSMDDLGDLGRDEIERQVAKRVAVLVRPGRVASWDHAKLR
jgi:PPOX class probable F420-dependent enzyme